MLPDHLDVVHLEHANELLREVQQDRLAKRALAGGEARSPLRGRALDWLGRRMVLWGSRLQQRYGGTVVAPMPRAADRGH